MCDTHTPTHHPPAVLVPLWGGAVAASCRAASVGVGAGDAALWVPCVWSHVSPWSVAHDKRVRRWRAGVMWRVASDVGVRGGG